VVRRQAEHCYPLPRGKRAISDKVIGFLTTMLRKILTLHSLVRLLVFALPMACATISQAAQPAPPKADPCVEELRAGRSEWIECYGGFETDASSQEELSRQTFNMVRNAKCAGMIRVKLPCFCARSFARVGTKHLLGCSLQHTLQFMRARIVAALPRKQT
jgi:hypothetical protein